MFYPQALLIRRAEKFFTFGGQKIRNKKKSSSEKKVSAQLPLMTGSCEWRVARPERALKLIALILKKAVPYRV